MLEGLFHNHQSGEDKKVENKMRKVEVATSTLSQAHV